MRTTLRTSLIATVLAVVATTLIAGPTSAAPTSKPQTLTLYAHMTTREVLDLGGPGPSIGDVHVGGGQVSRQPGGPVAGSYDFRGEVVHQSQPVAEDSLNSVVWFTMPRGSIAGAALLIVPRNGAPTAAQEYIIIGGTGAYAGVAGTMTWTPTNETDRTAVFRFTSSSRDGSRALTKAPKPFSVFLTDTAREVLDLGTPGSTVGDVATGSGTVARTVGGSSIGSFVYRAETVRVAMPGGLESRNSTLWVTMPGGTVGTTSLVTAPSGTTPVAQQQYIVVGGTGKYAGVRGTMTLRPQGPGTFKAAFALTD